MEQAVAFMAGANFLVLGLSYFFNSGDWIAWIAHLQKQARRGSLTIGMINLLIGGFILGLHWKWDGIGLVLSIAGVLATINGTIYMLFPNVLPAVLEWQEPHCRVILLIASILLMAVGLASFCEWWQLAGYAVLSNEDLPPAVRNHLPPHAQDIFREAFNHAWEQYADPEKCRMGSSQEDAARRVAWAVKSW